MFPIIYVKGVEMDEKTKGFFLVLATAIISGVSIFINKLGLMGFPDPFVFTTLKNIAVAGMLVASLGVFRDWRSIMRLSGRQWVYLVSIGLVGGSIPFLLFFWGLSLTSSAAGSFIHKTMFIYVTVLAYVFLREKITLPQVGGGILLILGSFLLLTPTISAPDFGMLVILAATLLWSLETIISKEALSYISPKVVASGRMFFGSFFMLLFLVSTGRVSSVSTLSIGHMLTLLVTSLLLYAYVRTWYAGLARIPAPSAASVLLLGSPITTFLSVAFLSGKLSTLAALGVGSTVFGVVLYVGAFSYIRKWKGYDIVQSIR